MNKLFSHLFLLSIFVSLLFNVCNAQVDSACFDADFTRGCPPHTISITNCANGSGIQYWYGVGTDTFGVDLISDTFYLYTTPGKYTVMQSVNLDIGPQDFLFRENYIEVLDTLKPDFTVHLCEGDTVIVVINDTVYDQYNDEYIINWGDASPFDTLHSKDDTIHFYNDSSQRTIIVRGHYMPGDCGGSNSITITPFLSLTKPIIEKLKVIQKNTNSGILELIFNTDDYINYAIQQKTGASGAYQSIDTVSNSSGLLNYNIDSLNTITNLYCYKIVAFDICGNAITSEEICSINIEVTASNNQNIITWSGYISDTLQTYSLYRNDSLIQTTLDTFYIDSDVRCGFQYCYHVVADIQQNNMSSVSWQQCVTAKSTDVPDKVSNFYTTILNNTPQLSWEKPDSFVVKEYIISRSEDGGSFQPVDTLTDSNYTDQRANTGTTRNCYVVSYIDSCDNKADPSMISCPILLQGTIENFQTIKLSWTDYVGWQNGVKEYVFEWLKDDFLPYDSLSTKDTTYTDIIEKSDYQHRIYRVKAIADTPVAAVSYSNIVIIKQELFIPTAFTPNGDGLNEIFKIKAPFIEDFKMIIYNRWGEIIFVSNQMSNGWDGTINGKQAPVGVYAYLIEAKDFGGEQYTRSGTVTLLR